MSQLVNEAWRGLFQGGEHGKHCGSVPITVITPSSAEDALTILPQDGEAASPARSE
jgi:hypothetical protein